MSGRSNQKLKLLYVLDILKKYSDEEHPINAAEINDRLSELGIEAERKSVYNDIACLEQYGCDIIKTATPKRGWFIGSREFEVPEIYLLCDAVRSAKFISSGKTRELLQKLDSLLSVHQTAKLEGSVYFSLSDKAQNEELYYSIDRITSAIKANKQISLSYNQRYFDSQREIKYKSKKMVINPYALTWQDDHYYLIGNYAKYDNLIHLRLDRISKVEILKEKSRHFSEVSEYRDFFDTADYTNKLFGMYSGELCDVELCCSREISEQVLDRFSENIFIKKTTDTTFNVTVKAALSEALVTWIMNYGSKIKAVKPEALCEMIKQRALSVLENYKDA